MILITFDPNPISTAPQILAQFRVEAYSRPFPIDDEPGDWSLADVQPATIMPRRLTIPAGNGRYQIAIRFVRTSDGFVEPAYADTGQPETWPEMSRQIITCGIGWYEDAVPQINAGLWRRVSQGNTRIPLTIVPFDPAYRTVIQVKRQQDSTWQTVTTLSPAATSYNFDIASSGGIPSGSGYMGNTLEFRAFHLTMDDEEGPTSEISTAFAGVRPPSNLNVYDYNGTQWQLNWAGLQGLPAGAAATQPVMRAWPMPSSGETPLNAGVTVSREQTSVLVNNTGLSPQRFRFQHTVTWLDAQWPVDQSAYATAFGYPATNVDGVPPPIWADPLVTPLFNGANVHVINAIPAGSGAAVHLEIRTQSIVTGEPSPDWTYIGGANVTALGGQETFFVETPLGFIVTAYRARHQRTVEGSPVYSEYVTAAAPGFLPPLAE